MDYLLKLITVFLIAGIKYFWATPYSFGMKLNIWETFILMEAGGILGFLFYYYLFDFLFRELKLLWPKVYHFTPILFKVRFEGWRERHRRKRINASKFTKRNKIIVKLRRRYGMWGIIVLSPILLSIPVGAFIGDKYFKRTHHFITYMILSIFIWGIISVLIFSTLWPIGKGVS